MVKVAGRLRRGGGSGTTHYLSIGENSGAVANEIVELTTSFGYFESIREDVVGGSGWTVAEVNQAEVGLAKGSGGQQIEADALWVMVDYREVTSSPGPPNADYLVIANGKISGFTSAKG